MNDDVEENETTTEEVTLSIPPPAEPIDTESADQEVPAATISKREQQILDEQEYQRKLNQKIREAQQRLEAERQREEERQRQLELEEYEREQEQIRLAEEQRRAEEERLQRAIEERERENELKRQEEQRLQQQREELERKQAEETERLSRERQERAKKEEEERNERKKRLDLIMRRTRQVSPNSKVISRQISLFILSLLSLFSRKQQQLIIIKRIPIKQTGMIKNRHPYLNRCLKIVFQLHIQRRISSIIPIQPLQLLKRQSKKPIP